jgi:hypothetical protein
MTHGHEKSDPAIVARKSANKDRQVSAEPMEPRAGAKGNAIGHGMRRTPSWESMSHGLDRVRQAAKERKGERFTALLHHIDEVPGSPTTRDRRGAGDGAPHHIAFRYTESVGIPDRFCYVAPYLAHRLSCQRFAPDLTV